MAMMLFAKLVAMENSLQALDAIGAGEPDMRGE
jgi:hypothetical protein